MPLQSVRARKLLASAAACSRPQTYDPEKTYGEYTIYGGGKE
jgi:hypothetical protein